MDMRNLDIDLVRCFVAVADSRSFTAAAKRLYRSQSAISTRVQKLEALLGVNLFVRSSRQVELTAAGEQFCQYALNLLRLNDEALGIVSRGNLEGCFRLGIVEYLVPHRLPEVLARIRRLLPRVDLSVKVALSEALLFAFDSGELDLIVVKEQAGRGQHKPFREESLLWVANQNIEQPPPLVSMCLLPAPCAFRKAALDSLTSTQARWREAMTLSGIMGVQSCVRQGLGVSVLCESAMDQGMVSLPQGPSAWPVLPNMKLVSYERSPNILSHAVLDLLNV